jgi:hypothetical protein
MFAKSGFGQAPVPTVNQKREATKAILQSLGLNPEMWTVGGETFYNKFAATMLAAQKLMAKPEGPVLISNFNVQMKGFINYMNTARSNPKNQIYMSEQEMMIVVNNIRSALGWTPVTIPAMATAPAPGQVLTTPGVTQQRGTVLLPEQASPLTSLIQIPQSLIAGFGGGTLTWVILGGAAIFLLLKRK